MFDKCLVVLFLYILPSSFIYLHLIQTALDLGFCDDWRWAFDVYFFNNYCWFFYLYGLLIDDWIQFLDLVIAYIYTHTLWLFQLSFGQMAVGFMAMAWWVFLYSRSLSRSLSLSIYLLGSRQDPSSNGSHYHKSKGHLKRDPVWSAGDSFFNIRFQFLAQK